MTLRISVPSEEGVYQGSKWLKIQALVNADELAQFFSALGAFSIYHLTGVNDGKPIDPSYFLSEYGSWIENLKKGIVPSSEQLRSLLAATITDDLDCLWLQKVGENQFLTKIAKPVIQVQTHYFTYSQEDHVFRSMSMGINSIFWGLQFSFPQIYQNSKTMELLEIGPSPLFKNMQLWMRQMTLPTPFIVEGKRVNTSMRLGKNCFSWISSHPQLLSQNLSVLRLD